MVAINPTVRQQGEAFVSELADAALQAVAPQGVRATSVDLEVHLWNALAQKYSQLKTDAVEPKMGFDCQLAQLARTAYETALADGIRGPFIDLELGIWKAMKQVARQNRVPGGCVC